MAAIYATKQQTAIADAKLLFVEQSNDGIDGIFSSFDEKIASRQSQMAALKKKRQPAVSFLTGGE